MQVQIKLTKNVKLPDLYRSCEFVRNMYNILLRFLKDEYSYANYVFPHDNRLYKSIIGTELYKLRYKIDDTLHVQFQSNDS
jgi:hypothetical protein